MALFLCLCHRQSLGLSKIFGPFQRVFRRRGREEEQVLPRPVQVRAPYSRPQAQPDFVPGQFARSATPEDLTDVEEQNEQLHVQNSLQSIPSGSEPPRSTTTTPERTVPGPGANKIETIERVIEFLTDAAGTKIKRHEAKQLCSLIEEALPGRTDVSRRITESVGEPCDAVIVMGCIWVLREELASGSLPVLPSHGY